MAIPNKPFILAVLGVVIFITGIITMGTGIQTGKNAGEAGFIIGMAVMTGLISMLLAIFAVVGGIFRILPGAMAVASFIACLFDLMFTWMAAGSVGNGGRNSLADAFLAFAIITGILEIVFIFISVERHVFEKEKEERRDEHQDYVDVEPV